MVYKLCTPLPALMVIHIEMHVISVRTLCNKLRNIIKNQKDVLNYLITCLIKSALLISQEK